GIVKEFDSHLRAGMRPSRFGPDGPLDVTLTVSASPESQAQAMPAPPPDFPPPPPGVQRIRVGGNVQAAKLTKKIAPLYPPLAKQARIQGTVRFNALIDRDGNLETLQLVTGHPLLVETATSAVKQWVYETTLLNGQPVEVVTVIDVNFTLSQ